MWAGSELTNGGSEIVVTRKMAWEGMHEDQALDGEGVGPSRDGTAMNSPSLRAKRSNPQFYHSEESGLLRRFAPGNDELYLILS
jgi:hypothetical protein